MGLANTLEFLETQKELVNLACQIAEENRVLSVENKNLKEAIEFVALWAWRQDHPGRVNKLTDTERLSAIKYHPTIKRTFEDE